MNINYINKDYFDKNNNCSFKLECKKDSFLHSINQFKIPYSTNYSLPKNMQFGIEMEFENVSINQLSEELMDFQVKDGLMPTQDWYAKDDITVSNVFMDDYIGGEVNSPIMTGKKQEWKDLKFICDLIKKQGGYISENCSLQAHFDFLKLDFNNQDILNLIYLWYQYEDIIYQFSCGEDENLRYGIVNNAGSIREFVNTIINYQKWDDLFNGNLGEFKKVFGLDISRYLEYINRDYHDYSTIEFRTGNGTLNPIIIQNYIRLYSNLLRTVKKKNKNLHINSKLSKVDYFELENNLEKACSFADLIFINNFDKACFIKQYKKK